MLLRTVFTSGPLATLMLIACLMGQTMTASAKQLDLNVAMARPTMYIDGELKKGQNYVRIGLTGFELESEKERQPVNVAIVIDKSGSMQGDKIVQARKAAIQAVDRLRDDDIVSIITYDSVVTVVVPATKASDREQIKKKIQSIRAGGNTALFAGVSKAAGEARKFLDDQRVNRIILLSDGKANVGPSTPAELEQLGQSLIKEGISVSTLGLGLGYNENLMSRLALASSGNHVFIEDAENLVQVFQNEFDDVMSVVAQKIKIKAKLAEGIRPVKVLNYPADITGQLVSIDLGQLYSKQERYFVVEVEVPLGEKDSASNVGSVEVDYANMATETDEKLTSTVQVRFSDDEKLAEKDIDKEVLTSCIIQVANETNREATRLRDAGQIDEAKKLLTGNGLFLENYFRLTGSRELEKRCQLNLTQADNLEPEKWLKNRKGMIEAQYSDSIQQRFKGDGSKNSPDGKR